MHKTDQFQYTLITKQCNPVFPYPDSIGSIMAFHFNNVWDFLQRAGLLN